ncbi:MAG: hydroxymethylglutaryl-CoA lyase, partial [Planctomycetes bacterium]|nr:hydroxymethylglutaryl-CoA lyase [Planctomycetota bacterium]
PRDGLQNERAQVPVADKVAFVNALIAAGFPEVEVTSFVSPKWVPQLADGAEVMRQATRRAGTVLSALVPNERGLQSALESRVDKVSVFASASEGFSQRNVNASIAECLARLQPVVQQARAAGLPVRGYVSCVVRCPFDGVVSPAAVRSVSERLLAMGCTEIDLGDTIGAAEVPDIDHLLDGMQPLLQPSDITLHLHDTRGMASACVERALLRGVRSFDSSAAGLGGCPYAPGAPGNLATETLLATLERLGFTHGVQAAAVVAVPFAHMV